jgi:nonsense-mediated mRNA decay protein 3
MCVNCIRSQVDITEGIQKSVTILWCKGCLRYLQPPKHWVKADPESKELLTYCIKRVRGMAKVKLVDAAFIWTEPHSMRLKVKLTVQGEVLNGAILQQEFVVEFVVERHMCPACNRQSANPNAWVACVQVRTWCQVAVGGGGGRTVGACFGAAGKRAAQHSTAGWAHVPWQR